VSGAERTELDAAMHEAGAEAHYGVELAKRYRLSWRRKCNFNDAPASVLPGKFVWTV
jgi:hypothetical protein